MAATVICLRSSKSLFMRLSCIPSQLANDLGVHWSWPIARSCVNVLRRVWRHRVEAKMIKARDSRTTSCPFLFGGEAIPEPSNESGQWGSGNGRSEQSSIMPSSSPGRQQDLGTLENSCDLGGFLSLGPIVFVLKRTPANSLTFLPLRLNPPLLQPPNVCASLSMKWSSSGTLRLEESPRRGLRDAGTQQLGLPLRRVL